MSVSRVKLWGRNIGELVNEGAGSTAIFRYDRDFIGSGIEISPIVMPLSDRNYTFPALPYSTFFGLLGLFADSLPDKFGNAVIDQWLATQGRDPDSFNAVERLCYTGQRGMGALEYFPAIGPRRTKAEQIQIDALVDLASQVLHSRERIRVDAEKEDALKQIFLIGSSAGGSRAKAVIAWNEETNDIRSGQLNAGDGYGYWLIKFDGVGGNGDKGLKDSQVYTRIEYAYHLMATDAGIKMSECRLYQENGLYHFMTKRFDRDEATGGKFHMQTLGAMAHYDFNAPCTVSYEQAASICKKLNLTKREIEQFYRRMVFNVVANNNDDHVKNISFLMDRNGKWRLSPAYDITFAYKPGNFWLRRHQMSVNGKFENFTEEDLLSAGRTMEISRKSCKNIIEQVCASVQKWKMFAEEAKLPEESASGVYENMCFQPA